jgi:hypothetical protein
MHLSCIETNSCLKMDQNKIPHDPHHLGVASGASEIISEPMVLSAQTVHLSCVKISTIPKQTKMSFHLSLEPRSAIGCVQNDFCAYGILGAKYAPTLALSLNGPKWDST